MANQTGALIEQKQQRMKLALATCRLFTPRYIPFFLNPSPPIFSLPKFSFFNPKPKIPLGFCSSYRTMSPSTTPSASPPAVEVRENIDLTDKERQIFDRLLQVLRHFNLHTQLRVAGGWVRDKVCLFQRDNHICIFVCHIGY